MKISGSMCSLDKLGGIPSTGIGSELVIGSRGFGGKGSKSEAVRDFIWVGKKYTGLLSYS